MSTVATEFCKLLETGLVNLLGTGLGCQTGLVCSQTGFA